MQEKIVIILMILGFAAFMVGLVYAIATMPNQD